MLLVFIGYYCMSFSSMLDFFFLLLTVICSNSPLKLDGVNASQIVELLLHEWDPMKLSQQIMFSQQKCVRLERLKPLSSAFQGEIKAFQKCASSENHTGNKLFFHFSHYLPLTFLIYVEYRIH